MIMFLHHYWQEKGCAIIQATDRQVGAATYHPYMIFGTGSFQFVQLCTRPADGRAARHPNRLYSHHQLQVVFDYIPDEIEIWTRDCFKQLGLTNIKFYEDNWNNPTLGASGLGWEIRVNDMEVLQFTYMLQLAGQSIKKTELAFGLERLAMQVQKVDNVFDLQYSDSLSYRDVREQHEIEQTLAIDKMATAELVDLFDRYSHDFHTLVSDLKLCAYLRTIDLNYIFNLLNAKNVLSYNTRQEYIRTIRSYTKMCLQS